MIGTTTLSKLQKKHYEEIVKMFSSTNVIMLSDKEYIRLRDIIDILSTLGYVCICELTSQYAIKQIGDFSDFDKWHEDRKREERKLSSREWKIGIVAAGIGLIPFIITTVIPWIISLLSDK